MLIISELPNAKSASIAKEQKQQPAAVESAIKNLLPTSFGDILEIVLLFLHIMWFHKTSKEIEQVDEKVEALDKKIEKLLEAEKKKTLDGGSRRRYQHYSNAPFWLAQFSACFKFKTTNK